MHSKGCAEKIIMNYKVAIVSLGCNKNLVDSEILAKYLNEAGHTIINSCNDADIIFVNTCGFINAAKEEAINTIFEMLELKNCGVRGVFVTGCLAKRYSEQLLSEIHEIDGILGVYDYDKVSQMLCAFEKGNKFVSVDGNASYMDNVPGRIIATPKYSAYLKIADGCANKCHYCAIPAIRGEYCSRTLDSLLDEARALYKQGVRELLVTAQDTTRYGQDKGENKFLLL